MTLALAQPVAPAITGSRAEDALLLGACCAALATLVPVMLFQTGIVDSLPDPPLAVFDSEEITSSRMAHPFGVPDSLPGLASFGATLALILLARRSPVARRLLGAKLVVDGSAATFNATRQVLGFGKLCSWCTGTALAAGVMVYAGRGVIAETVAKAESL
jgi:uncharacterized membrane protein